MNLRIGDTIAIRTRHSIPLLGLIDHYDLVTIENDKQLAKYSAMLGSKNVQAKAGR